MRKYYIFIILLSMYIYLDNLGFQNYKMLISAFGWVSFILTMSLNLLISAFSAITVDKALSSQTKGGIGVGFGNAIGAFFAGCTSCGVSLLAVIGVTFSLPVVTPGAIEYKLLALLLVLVTYFYTIRKINKGCKLS